MKKIVSDNVYNFFFNQRSILVVAHDIIHDKFRCINVINVNDVTNGLGPKQHGYTTKPVSFVFERARTPIHFLFGKWHPPCEEVVTFYCGAFHGHQGNGQGAWRQCLREVSGLHNYVFFRHTYVSTPLVRFSYSQP